VCPLRRRASHARSPDAPAFRRASPARAATDTVRRIDSSDFRTARRPPGGCRAARAPCRSAQSRRIRRPDGARPSGTGRHRPEAGCARAARAIRRAHASPPSRVPQTGVWQRSCSAIGAAKPSCKWHAQASFATMPDDCAPEEKTMTRAEDFPIEGGCTCRAVRYRMTSAPMFVHCCHCRWCQRETGASFALNAMIEADRVQLLQGEIEIVDTPSNSGKGQKISRCPRCRIAVWSNYAGGGNAIRFVRVGTLDAPDLLPPDVHIFTASKQPWVVLPPDTPAAAEYYKASELWPKESLERRAALRARQP